MKKRILLIALCLMLLGSAAAETLSAAPGQAVAYSYTGDIAVTLNGQAYATLGADGWQRGLIPLPEGGEIDLAFTGEVQRVSLIDEAEAQAILAAGPDMGVYAISVTDPEGAPLPGAMAQVCDAASCRLERTDENGRILLTLPRFAYEVHLLRAPQGYSLPDEAILMPEEGGRWEIALQKTN